MTKNPNDLAYPRLCGLLATKPTKLSQAMHNAGFRALGLDFHYSAFDTADTQGGIEAMRLLGLRGLSLTIPHKEAALPLVDISSDEAISAGSINTVINDGLRLSGYNTDIFGITSALGELPFAGERAVLIGAGGAARAGIVAMKQLGLESISITNRSDERAAKLATEFGIHFLPWTEFGPQTICDLLVNATPVGSPLTGETEAKSFSERCPARKDMTVFDMVTRDTALLERARSQGARIVPGRRMLLFQALEQFRLFTDVEAPKAVMEEALAQALAV